MTQIAPTINGLFDGGLPVRLTAYDGSVAGDPDSPYGLEISTQRGLQYILTAPGDLGLARAYVSGDAEIHGTHAGDPYPLLSLILEKSDFARPSIAKMVDLVRELGINNFVPPPPPPQEHLPQWRQRIEDVRHHSLNALAQLPMVRHSQARDADAIHHHYDVSNTFYEWVLGPSMTYTCALFEKEDATLEEAQFAKYDLICKKLDLQPGQRLLDIGCGWGGMVRHAAKHYGVKALGVTLSREQATWAQEAIKREGLDDVAEVRFGDYRDVTETGFDAISSIGLTEHIGVANYPAYFGFMHARVKEQGRILNHCITRIDNKERPYAGSFIDRYVFPDGELIGSGTIVSAIEDAGFEVQHHENIRMHYTKTLAGWNKNLVDHWDEAVEEVGLPTAKVWGLYMAGSRLGFERNNIQLHHVLATKTVNGLSGYPMRHEF
ncbi:MAG: class I SAM-dependent methyltransferase [Nocardioides sp.]|nr:class I SAM-dependent methyltransferase [Nocardioides sp.]